MKAIKNLSLLVTLFCINLNVLTAQNSQPTPYQKKQLELSKKYFQIFYGYKMTMADEAFYNQLAEGKDVQDFLLAIGIIDYATNNTESQVKKVLTQMKDEYTQAEKLKNATDFKLEEEARVRKEQEIYDRTDFGAIRKKIKYSFEEWNQKGEFEKESDYILRLKNKSKVTFDAICLDAIINKIESKDPYYWRKELSVYNSEDEFFTVTFKINNVEWKNDISIPINKAQNFKEEWNYFKFNINNYDWCFIENNLCPTLVTLEHLRNKTENQKFLQSLNNQSEILYSFNDLNINNKYLEGYIFKYSNAKAIAEEVNKEKKRLDSLEVSRFNQRLDSTFINYNYQLLQNPYNIDKKILPEYSKIVSKDKEYREVEYNRKTSAMKDDFDKLSSYFQSELRNEYQKNGPLFESVNEFDTFYKKGRKEYLLELDKKKIFKFLSDNSQFIVTMDFQNEKKDNIESNKTRERILSTIEISKNKPHNSQVLDYVVKTNVNLNNEWNKNGHFFENKNEFYNAYISGNYKSILKGLKKNNK